MGILPVGGPIYITPPRPIEREGGPHGKQDAPPPSPPAHPAG